MTVSIVIPTHQRAGMVARAIASVLAQRDVDLEVIVVDDGSTDGTGAVVGARFQDSRVRYIWQPNGGRSSARNHGLALARGAFVGFLDSDDQLAPGALSAHLAVHATHPGLGMSVAGYAVVDVHDAVLDQRLPWKSGGELDLAGWLFDCYGIPGAVLHRRDWLVRVGGFDEMLEMAEDWDLYLRLAAIDCPMRWVPIAACRYLRHEGSSVNAIEDHWRASRRVVEGLFDRADLSAAVRGLEQRARAWVDLDFARRAYAGGDHALGALCLAHAMDQDPGLRATGISAALDFLVLPAPSGAPPKMSVAEAIAVQLGVDRADVHAAEARGHIMRFRDAALRADWPVARRSLAAGLRRDPRWLSDGTVLRLAARTIASSLGWRRAQEGRSVQHA